MRIPSKPPVGHLIAYEYLWQSQRQGREDRVRTYPTAVVVAREDMGPLPFAYVLGISHKPPLAFERTLEVPLKLKRHLGLDDEPAWIYTDQVNVFAWPGPDVRPADRLSSRPEARGSCVIGRLPDKWFEAVKQHLAESYRLGKVSPVPRST